ncbi:hypothetical protein ES702_02621 [subsurface metagenome]
MNETDIEFVQEITPNGVNLKPKIKSKQKSLMDFFDTLIEHVGEIELSPELKLYFYEIDKEQYCLLSQLRKLEKISQQASNLRYWNIRDENNFIYPHKTVSRTEIWRFLPQQVKLVMKKGGEPFILLTISDTIIYLSRARTPQTPIIKKALIELEKAKRKQYKQLEKFLIKELEISDQEIYSKVIDEKGKLVWSKYESIWGTSLWRSAHRHRFELAKIKKEIPFIWKFEDTVLHHPKGYRDPHHLFSDSIITLKKKHKKGVDKING